MLNKMFSWLYSRYEIYRERKEKQYLHEWQWGEQPIFPDGTVGLFWLIIIVWLLAASNNLTNY